MTIEAPMRFYLNTEIAECQVKSAAILDRVDDIDTWLDRKTRPLDVHREIKNLRRELCHPSEKIVAAMFCAAAVKLAVDEYQTEQAKLAAYQNGLELLNESYADNG